MMRDLAAKCAIAELFFVVPSWVTDKTMSID
jgi:hypothetical protein